MYSAINSNKSYIKLLHNLLKYEFRLKINYAYKNINNNNN